MADQITVEQQQYLQAREALSDLFVDNEVDYAYIAKRICSLPRATIKNILFSEVAPVCYSNLCTPVPPVWAGFSPDWLHAAIDKRLAQRQRSWHVRLQDHLLIIILMRLYASEWKELELALQSKSTT